jgi:hypothetical protein
MYLVRQFQVTGAPTTLLFSPEAKEKHRFPGFYSQRSTSKNWSRATEGIALKITINRKGVKA